MGCVLGVKSKRCLKTVCAFFAHGLIFIDMTVMRIEIINRLGYVAFFADNPAINDMARWSA